MKYKITNREKAAIKKAYRECIEDCLQNYVKSKKMPMKTVQIYFQEDEKVCSFEASFLSLDILKNIEVALQSIFQESSQYKKIKRMEKVVTALGKKDQNKNNRIVTGKQKKKKK